MDLNFFVGFWVNQDQNANPGQYFHEEKKNIQNFVIQVGCQQIFLNIMSLSQTIEKSE